MFEGNKQLSDRLYHYHHYKQICLKALDMFNANQVYAIEYVIKLTFIITIILYAEYQYLI